MRDLHIQPFDDGTKSKLSIFKDYIREWLPVFIASKKIYWSTLNIFDFFAGPGTDVEGNKGTPLIILDELDSYKIAIDSKKLKVNLYFNEYLEEKRQNLETILNTLNSRTKTYNITTESKDFLEAFTGQYNIMNRKDCVNLILLDQTGIKHITEKVFLSIVNLKRTDFLFFISSSTIKRFADHPSISQYIKLDSREIEKIPYHKIHRKILEYYRELIPKNKEYYLASFSLKKKAGIYGLIFGSGHVLGIEKFLRTCWANDPERGEANFDIDEDKIIPSQLDIFTGEVRKPKKVDFFEEQLIEGIKSGQIVSNKDVYLFTLRNGFLPKHAAKVISELEEREIISVGKFPLTHKLCNIESKPINIKVN